MLAAVLERDVAKETVAAALDKGLIINAPTPGVVRFTPPLVITDDELEAASTRFGEALMQVINGNA